MDHQTPKHRSLLKDFDGLQRKVSEVIQEQQIPTSVVVPLAHPKGKGANLAKVTLQLPEYLLKALQERTHNEPRCTLRYIMLHALRKDGWHIDDADYVNDIRQPDKPNPDIHATGEPVVG